MGSSISITEINRTENDAIQQRLDEIQASIKARIAQIDRMRSATEAFIEKLDALRINRHGEPIN